jgi:hypothetical protein
VEADDEIEVVIDNEEKIDEIEKWSFGRKWLSALRKKA